MATLKLDGWGNGYAPDDEQIEQEEFESNNLIECAQYARDYKDLDPLDSAIVEQQKIIEKAISDLGFCIDCLQHNVLVKNILIKIKNKLMSNQKRNE